MKTWHDPTKTIHSDETLFDIVETIADSDGATLTELVDQLNMAQSTLHNHLSTLIHRGYIIKDGHEYHLSLLFLNLGTHARERYKVLPHVKPRIERLANETQERTHFVVEEYGRAYVVYRGQGSHAIQSGPLVGDPMYLHNNAAGKAILSELPEKHIQRIIDHWGLSKTTEHTINDEEELLAELKTINDQGYAMNREEDMLGFRAVGAPVVTDHGVIGAISVGGPATRLQGKDQQKIKEVLLGIVNEIELDLGEV